MAANSSRQLYQAFLKRGMNKEDAFFAIIDHYNNLHWHDRNLWAGKIAKLEMKVAELDQQRAVAEPSSDASA